MLNTNQEQLERVTNLLKQAGAVLETIDLTPRKSPAEMFLQTLAANLDNEKLTDADFRQFVRNSLPDVLPKSAPASHISRKHPHAIVRRIPG